MISLLECIITQGYSRPACFRTSYLEVLEAHYLPAQQSKSPPWIMSPCSPSWGATWCVSWVFAVAAEFLNCTWQSALHTCCTPTPRTRARFTAFWCKRAYACIRGPHTGGSARQLNFAKWSEASVSVAVVCMRVCVGARLASGCLLLCTSAGAHPFSWHVDDTRGLSGRCVLCFW